MLVNNESNFANFVMKYATERVRETCNLNALGRRTFYVLCWRRDKTRLKIWNEAIANIEIIGQKKRNQ